MVKNMYKNIIKTTLFSFSFSSKISLTMLIFVAYGNTCANMDASHPWLFNLLVPFICISMCLISLCYILFFGSLMFDYPSGFSKVFYVFGLFFLMALFFISYDYFQVVECAPAVADINVPAEVILENDLKEKKSGSFFSYKNMAIVVISILAVSFFVWGGGGGGGSKLLSSGGGGGSELLSSGGGSGSELLSSVGQLGPVGDVVPIVAAVTPVVTSVVPIVAAAVTAATPVVTSVLTDNVQTVSSLSGEAIRMVNSNLATLEVSRELSELVLSRSTDYYQNFIGVLGDSLVQEALIYLMTPDSSGNQVLDGLLTIMRGPWDIANNLLTGYSPFVGVDLFNSALTVARSSVVALVLNGEELNQIISILAFVAVKALQDSTIVLALTLGNGYDVIASSLIERIEWSFLSSLIRASGAAVGMQIFTMLLSGAYVLGADPFVVSSMDLFRSILEGRTNGGSSILVNDSYILVMLLSDILKQFISEDVHFFFAFDSD